MAYGLYQRIFYETDRNHDGILDWNEFRNFHDFESVDRNHDGRIDMREFIHSAPHFGLHPRQAVQTFRSIDRNHNGVLGREEMGDFTSFQRADLNHDGRIDPYEMHQYLGNSRMHYGRRRY